MKKIIGFLLFLVFISSGNLVFCSQNYIVNGTTYTFPDEGDTDWGQSVTDWAGAVTTQLTSISTSGVLSQLKSTAAATTIGFNNVADSTATLTNMFSSVAISTRSNFEGNTTSYLNINYSTQTKKSGLILNGDLVANRLYGDGGGLANLYSALSSVQGLVITTNGANSSDFIITADRVVIGPTSSYFVNIATSISINRSGPGGIDTGTKSSDTWNTLWMLTGTTVSVVASSGMASSPVLPSGYTGYKAIGYIKISTGGAIIPYQKNGLYGEVCYFDFATPIVNATAGQVSEISLSLKSYIPPRTDKVKFHSYFAAQATRSDTRVYLRVPGEIGLTTENEFSYGVIYSASSGYLVSIQEVTKNMRGQQSIFYQTAASDSDGFKLYIKSYTEAGL